MLEVFYKAHIKICGDWLISKYLERAENRTED